MHLCNEKDFCAHDNSNKMSISEANVNFRRQIPSNVNSPRQRPGIRTVSSWRQNQNQHDQQQQHARSWPVGSKSCAQQLAVAAAEETVSCYDKKTMIMSDNPKGAGGNGSKPLIHHQRHSLKNRFHLLRTLGEGTYGKVKLAVDKGTGEHVAIKYIKKTKIQDENDQARIRREIQILSSLKHQHVVNIREVFEKKDKIVLVMDYAPGGELYDYLNKMGKLSECEARRIFRQIVSAIDYCHQTGIVHRDLKLENIILDNEGNVKMADFGLSNYYTHNSTLTTFCGSPLYASPEIVNGTPYHGPEVDIWSLGVILYTLVYGAMPFESDSLAILKRQISHGDYTRPSKPSDAAGLIRHMLTVSPTRRASMKDVLHHWWVNLGCSQLPNGAPYCPDQELSITAPTLATDKSSLVPISPVAIHHSNHNCPSTDPNVKRDVRPNSWPKRTVSRGNAGIISSSPVAVSRAHSSYIHGTGESTDPVAIPSDLLKLPPDVLEILKGCSIKTLASLVSTDTMCSDVDMDISGNINNELYQSNVEDSKADNSEVGQASSSVVDSDKKPIRGILKRKGKFSGGDSGCVMPEDMATKIADIAVQDPGHLTQKLSSLEVEHHDVFAMEQGSRHPVDCDSRCLHHEICSTTISHTAWSKSSSQSARQRSHSQELPNHPVSSQTPQDTQSVHGCRNEITEGGIRSITSVHSGNDSKHKPLLNKQETYPRVPARSELGDFTCDNVSIKEPGKGVHVPKSILKFCKTPSLDENMKRLSISSYGSNSSVDVLDLSYDSSDSGHVANAGSQLSKHAEVRNGNDNGFHDDQTIVSDQRSHSMDESLRRVQVTDKPSCKTSYGCQHSISHESFEFLNKNSSVFYRLTISAQGLQ